jgi:hypothetical protein
MFKKRYNATSYINATYVAIRLGVHESFEHFVALEGSNNPNQPYSLKHSLKREGYTVFTKRISFQSSTNTRYLYIVERGVLVSNGYSKDLAPGDIVKLTSMGVYTPLLYGEPLDYDRARRHPEIIHTSTRIPIWSHNEKFKTPHLPDPSSSGVEELGIAFIYPNPSVLQVEIKPRQALRLSM